jgi:hypothetical protein
MKDLQAGLDRMRGAIEAQDVVHVRDILAKLVTEYTPAGAVVDELFRVEGPRPPLRVVHGSGSEVRGD